MNMPLFILFFQNELKPKELKFQTSQSYEQYF